MALPDLDVRSVLDVVEENFQNAGLKSYAIRMIYIGEHTLKREELIKQFQSTVNDVNAGYCDVNVAGLLLVYDSYFVHVVEGSEDTVHRHLRFLFQREEKRAEKLKKLEEMAAAAEDPEEEPVHFPEKRMLKRLKLLIVYHSIKTRAFDGWRAVTGRPPALIGNLEAFGPLADHIEQLRICLEKISKLCIMVKADETITSFDTKSAGDHKMEVLPEVALLDFLLQSQHIIDLRHALHLHRRVDDYVFYFETVWPLPTHFTPRLLYKLKIDDSFVEPLPVMPWETVQKETGEDEEREDQSGSSSTELEHPVKYLQMDRRQKKKLKKKLSRRPVSNIMLPPIEQNSSVKTIIDVDPDFYSLVEGRPIRPNLSINKYKQNVKNIALTRTVCGFLTDEILRINREIKTERQIFEIASKHFEECQYSFDKFLADDNNKTIAIMQKSDSLARDLVNQTEEHKKASYELATLKSKLQYIDETLQIMLSFQTFLHRAAPILWQDSQNINVVTEYVEIFTMDNDIFSEIDKNLIQNRLQKLPPPCLYFQTPEQLLTTFGLLEKQNLNYLLVTEELNSVKNKFLKSLRHLKLALRLELEYIQQKISEIREVIAWNEAREIEVKKTFFKILEENIKYYVSSKIALQIFNYVEFAYEKLIAPNNTGLSSLDMTSSLEREYNDLMLNLSAFDLNEIKAIEKETYEQGALEVKQADAASKLLKDVDKLSRRLKASYEL